MFRVVACACWLTAAGATSAAAAPVARLVTEGEVCPLGDLPARVGALLAREPFAADAPAVVRVELARHDGRVTARVTFEDADGQRRGPRRVDAASCDALVDSIALVVAMGMPPDVAQPQLPARLPHVAPTRGGGLELRAAAPPTASPRPTTRSELAVTAGGGAILSSNGWAQQLAVGLRWRRARDSLALELRLASPEAVAVEPMGRVHVAVTQVAAAGCRHAGDFAFCAALSLGEVRGSGADLFDAREATLPLVAGGGRLGWEHTVWRGLRAHLEIGADVRATTTQLDVDHMAVWTSSRIQAWAGAGVIARFL